MHDQGSDIRLELCTSHTTLNLIQPCSICDSLVKSIPYLYYQLFSPWYLAKDNFVVVFGYSP